MEVALVLGLLIIAVVLFATERFSVDIVTLFLLIVLVLAGIINSKEAFESFSSDFIIMLASIFVITSAIENSGVMDVLSGSISKTRAARVFGVMLWMMPFAGLVSGFMNNTTLTALLIPPLLGIANKSKVSPSRLLMPMAFANIVGGTWTVIGTSTNIAVSGYLAKEGYGRLGIFDIAPIGLTLLGIYMTYMLTVGRLLLPDRQAGMLMETYKVREYMSEIKILPESSLAGQMVYDSGLVNSGFQILGIIRNGRKFFPYRNSTFEEDDVVLVSGNVKDLLAIKDKSGIDIMADVLEKSDGKDTAEEMIQLSEVLIPAYSGLAGKTIKRADFRRRYGLVVVAVHRTGINLTQKIGSIRLRAGDLLLVQGTPERLADFHDEHNLVFLDDHEVNPNRVRNGFIAMGIFLIAVVLTTFKVVPIDIAFLSAALATVVLRIKKPGEVYESIDWRLLVLIGGMSAFGTAMKNSGADVFVSDLFLSVFDSFGPRGIMLGFMLITILLTQPMSNAAAALVVLPIALKTAETLHVNPMAFGIAVMLSASISILTPFEPSCILIYGPGRYRFMDFIKVGGPLTVILALVIYFMVPLFWPLEATKL